MLRSPVAVAACVLSALIAFGVGALLLSERGESLGITVCVSVATAAVLTWRRRG